MNFALMQVAHKDKKGTSRKKNNLFAAHLWGGHKFSHMKYSKVSRILASLFNSIERGLMRQPARA